MVSLITFSIVDIMEGKIKMDELISVIMSVYNESSVQLLQSINSIVGQTYENLEIIIVNDNPRNERICQVLYGLTDKRIKIVSNKKNEGLVYSLNKAIFLSHGSYIARMDADDVSDKYRLEKEINYLKSNNLDLVGTWIELIDEKDNDIGNMKFPISLAGIKKQIKLGGCVAHPTWLAKKELFLKLQGYRNISYCEDYDFILRALDRNYKIGNIPYFGLKYRVRNNGVSLSNKNKQLIIRRFLSYNAARINRLTVQHICDYIESDDYRKEYEKLNRYEVNKNKIKTGSLKAFFYILCNRNIYIFLKEKVFLVIYHIIYR